MLPFQMWLNNSDGAAFIRASLMVPAALYCGHTDAGVGAVVQVGQALPCPCSNLLDLNQQWLGRRTVPCSSQVTPLPRPHMWDLGESRPRPWWMCDVLPPAAVSVSWCPSVFLCVEKTRPGLFSLSPYPSLSTTVRQGWEVSTEALTCG